MIQSILARLRNRVCQVDSEPHDEETARARKRIERVQERLDMVRQAKFEAEVLSQARSKHDRLD